MLFLLDRNENVVAVFSNSGAPGSCPYYDDLLIEDLETGAASYTVSFPHNHEKADKVTDEGYIVREDLDGNLIMFGILTLEESHSHENDKIIYSETAGLELLNDFIRPITHNSKNAGQILDLVLDNTGWQKGQVDYFGVDNYTFDQFENVFAALQKIKTQVNGELRFRVKKVNGEYKRYVDLIERRGTDSGKRFVYTKDIMGLRKKIDRSQLATALVGIGTGDSQGKLTDFKSVSKYGKPLGQDWVGDETALDRYGKKGKHLLGKFEYDTDNPTVLLDKTYLELQRRKTPMINYEVDVVLLERLAGIEHEKVRIGDTVRVIDKSFSPELLLEARILNLETSFTDPSRDKAILGNFKMLKSNISKQMRELQSKLLQRQGIWDNGGEAFNIAVSAQTDADVAKTEASNSVTIAGYADTRALDAQTMAENAVSIASNAESTSFEAVETANQSATTVTEMQSVIDSLTLRIEELERKASDPGGGTV